MANPEAAVLLQDPAADEASWGFQIQQAVEKALWPKASAQQQAWIFLLEQNPPFTHDLVALLKLLQQAGIDIAAHRDLARFTDFAVQILYDEQPDSQNLDRLFWNARAEALVVSIEAMLQPPRVP